MSGKKPIPKPSFDRRFIRRYNPTSPGTIALTDSPAQPGVALVGLGNGVLTAR